jgi:hypothetical protein
MPIIPVGGAFFDDGLLRQIGFAPREKTTMRLFFATACLLAAGCDFTPTAPFEGFEGEGATLTGHFENEATSGASSSLSQRTLAASVADAVTAVVSDLNGNEIASVDVENGEFTLRGLPESFVLVFEDEGGQPLGDPMTFEGVKPNQEVSIVVALLDGEVVLIEETRRGIGHEGSDGIEIEGIAQNVVIQTAPMTGSLDVNGYHVLTRAAETSIRKGGRSLTLEDLSAGDRVHVRGVFEGADVLAHEIMLQDEDEEDESSSSTCNVPDPSKSNHVLVCHKGRTLSISPDAWPGHAGHGDTCGPCGS